MSALTEAEAYLARARVHWARGEPTRSRSQINLGLELAGGSGTPVEARLLIERARLQVLDGDASACLAAAVEAAGAARTAGICRADAELVVGYALYSGFSRGSLDRYRAARKLARREGDIEIELEAGNCLAGALHAFGRPRSAIRAAQVVRERAAAAGKRVPEGLAQWLIVRLRLYAFGEVERAPRELADLLEHPGISVHRPQVIADLAVALADGGRIDEARRWIVRGRQEADTPFMTGAVCWAHAEVEWASGRPARALAAADEALALPLISVAREAVASVRRWALYDLGRPEPDLGMALGDDVFSYVQRVESEGFAALAAGDVAFAHVAFRRAVARWRGIQPRDEVRALWAAGVTASTLGRKAQARSLLREAEGAALHHGLVAVLARIRQSLHALEPDRPGARSSRSSLTRREREVLALVSRGLASSAIANQLAIERTTVETHIRSAMAKLGARTRIQAAHAAAGCADTTRRLDQEDLVLLELLADGETVAAAARLLALSRRTAVRRLARARSSLGVETNAEAVGAVARPRPSAAPPSEVVSRRSPERAGNGPGVRRPQRKGARVRQ